MTSHVCYDHARHCADAAQLREMAADPTLASCCQRDAQEQAVVAKLKASLTLVDRSRHREHLRESVLGCTPGDTRPDRDSLETSDDEELDKLRSARLHQLQAAAREARSRRESGHGTLQTLDLVELKVALWFRGSCLGTAAGVHARIRVCSHIPRVTLMLQDFLKRAEAPVVIHACLEGSSSGHEADEILTLLASRSLEARFIRIEIGRKQIPQLPAFFQGQVPALAWIHEEVAGPVLALPADDEEVGNLEPRIQRWCSGLASRAASLGPASTRGEATHEPPSEVRLIMTPLPPGVCLVLAHGATSTTKVIPRAAGGQRWGGRPPALR
ncbi:hypothetical protein ACKKBF_B35425 [Auxenochlorella protothecoides x Auxenochlorella symbiontica]